MTPLAAQVTTAATDTVLLRSGDRIARNFVGGSGVDLYVLHLSKGSFVLLETEQRNNSIIVALLDSTGRILADRDDPQGPYGPAERLSFIVPFAGRFLVRLSGYDGNQVKGSYVLRVSALRDATARDSLAAAAEAIHDRATELDLQFRRDSVASILAFLQDALRRWRELGDAPGEQRTRMVLGSLYGARGDGTNAIEHFAASRDRAEEAGDTLGMGYGEGMLGVAESRRGNLLAALAHFDRASLYAAQARHPAFQARSSNNAGLTRLELGDPVAAVVALRASLEFFTALGEDEGIFSATNNLASAFANTGEMDLSLDMRRVALELAQRTGDSLRIAIALNNLGGNLYDIGREREALDFQRRSLPYYRASQDISGLASALSNVGLKLLQTDEAEGLRVMDESLKTRRIAEDIAGESITLANLGYHFGIRRNDSVRARPYLDSALALARRASAKVAEANALLVDGQVRLRMGDVAGGLASATQSLAVAEGGSLRRRAADAYGLIARAQAERGDYASARAASRTSIGGWETLRRRLRASGLRTTFGAEFAIEYETAIDIAMREFATTRDTTLLAEAFDLAEQSRARMLSELLSPVGNRLALAADSALIGQRTAVQRRISDVAGRAARQPQLQAQLDSLLNAFDDVESRLRASSAGYAAASTSPVSSSVTLRREVLDSGAVLLQYVLGRDRSYVFALTTTSINASPLPPRASIDSIVRRFYDQVSARTRALRGESAARWRARVTADEAALPTTISQLSQLLVAPVREHIGKRAVVVSPTGSLQFVPFALLDNPGVDGRRQPLIATHVVTVLPSASTVGLLRKREATRQQPKRTLALFADPVFAASDERLGLTRTLATRSADALGPDVSSQLAFVRAVVESGAADEGDELPRLVYSRREAEAIAPLVEKSLRSERYGFDASIAAARDSALRGYRIIHFASHALTDDIRPELSGIVLSAVDRAGQPVDGFLRLHQIYQMQLNADLVVLSACQTALGLEIRGEGAMSLARGFLQAGASRVVASLWKVDDRATAALMTHFYRNMLGAAHMPPAAALRQAQLTLRRDPRWSAPYFWSGFVLQGDWR
ncbi:MAG: CHAT domain-containing protein [Gemmatimonadaceae bacterium]|nr:CHAT domain-containing protein [Gemmatimonadaceae bacterium]